MTGARASRGEIGQALVVGGDSLVGATIYRRCRETDVAVAATSRRSGANLEFLDLAHPDFAPIERADYGCAFICAAVTDMRACQENPPGTWRVNVENTLELMRRLADKGAHLVFLSSSQVFDGEMPMPGETDATNPKNEYGKQKLAVEEAIAREELPAATLRVTKVLADHPVGMFKKWFESLRKGEGIEAATNMTLSPVMVHDVAKAAVLLAAGRRRGIWHLSAIDEVPYDEAARLMAESRGFASDLVTGKAVTESQVPSIYRHRYTALSSRKISESFSLSPLHARATLETLFARFA